MSFIVRSVAILSGTHFTIEMIKVVVASKDFNAALKKENAKEVSYSVSKNQVTVKTEFKTDKYAEDEDGDYLDRFKTAFADAASTVEPSIEADYTIKDIKTGKLPQDGTNFSIQIQLSDTGAEWFNDHGYNICLTKGVTVDSATNETQQAPVVWLSISDILKKINLSWIETFYYYATLTEIKDKVVVEETSQTDDPISTGYLYLFSNGSFTEKGNGPEGAFDMKNAYKDMKFGLAQPLPASNARMAKSSDSNIQPINITFVGYNMSAQMIPTLDITVFASGSYVTGAVTVTEQSGSLPFTLSTSHTSQTIHWDDDNHVFQLGPLPSSHNDRIKQKEKI